MRATLRLFPTLAVGFIAGLLAEASQAALVASSLSFDARADQRILVPAGSPLNGAPFSIPPGSEFDLSALGSVSMSWDADADSNGSTTLSSFTATFAEVHPQLGSYSLAASGTGPGASFTGSLDNIVDNAGALVSADFTLNTTFSLVFNVPGQPLIYTKDQATFTGVIRGGNATIGEVFTSGGTIDGFLSAGNPATDVVAARSFNRTVTAVPEPASGALACLCCGVLAVVRRRRSAEASAA